MFIPRATVTTVTQNATSVHYTVTYESKWAKNQASDACARGALFFRDNSVLMLVCTPLLLAIVSIILTISIRETTPQSYKVPAVKKEAQTEENESTSIPDPSQASTCTEAGITDDPPPYGSEATPEAETNASPTNATVDKPQKKHSSAHNFVVGSALFFPNLVVLFLGALSVQAILHCGPWSPIHPLLAFIWWFIYSMVAWFASFGFMCWLMLLRNLWGPKMAKKYPLEESAFLVCFIGVVISPFVVVGLCSIRGIEWLQKRFCGDAIEEDEEDGVELEDACENDSGSQAGGSDAAGREERVGLMGGMEK